MSHKNTRKHSYCFVSYYSYLRPCSGTRVYVWLLALVWFSCSDSRTVKCLGSHAWDVGSSPTSRLRVCMMICHNSSCQTGVYEINFMILLVINPENSTFFSRLSGFSWQPGFVLNRLYIKIAFLTFLKFYFKVVRYFDRTLYVQIMSRVLLSVNNINTIYILNF